MTNKTGLGELLERGGIHYSLPGDAVYKVMDKLIGIAPVPETVTAKDLFRAVMEREALMSTGIGNGIATPHPRNPVITRPEDQFAALAFLEQGVDWRALDNIPVDTVFLIVSASAQFHLKILSEVSFFCRQDEFKKLLTERAAGEEIIGYIKNTEKEWE